MKPSKNSIILPILLITFGIGWLLTSWEIAPEIDWPWILGLAAAGILTLAVLGLDKVTVVLAPLLVAGSFASIFHQLGVFSLGVIVPMLIILAGLLLLVARRPSIAVPKWIVDSSDGKSET